MRDPVSKNKVQSNRERCLKSTIGAHTQASTHTRLTINTKISSVTNKIELEHTKICSSDDKRHVFHVCSIERIP